MFKRRAKKRTLETVRDAFWPRRGWMRALTYYRHRLVRVPDSNYRIAAGFACGAALSFTPFLGLHSVGAILLALIVRGNLLAAVIGTIIGNPLTFPFIWLAVYQVGSWMVGAPAPGGSPLDMSMGALMADPLNVLRPYLFPMTIGSLPLGFIAWWLHFWIVRGIVRRYKQRRELMAREGSGYVGPMRRSTDPLAEEPEQDGS